MNRPDPPQAEIRLMDGGHVGFYFSIKKTKETFSPGEVRQVVNIGGDRHAAESG